MAPYRLSPEPVPQESWAPILLFAGVAIIWIALIIRPILFALFI